MTPIIEKVAVILLGIVDFAILATIVTAIVKRIVDAVRECAGKKVGD